MMYYSVVFLVLFTIVLYTYDEVSDTDLNDLSEQQNSVQINKFCEENEIADVCRLAEKFNESETTELRPIFDLGKSEDKLNLLSDGRLKHLIHSNLKDIDFLMKKILNPIFHAIAMILYLTVAIIYFVFPTLRDLAGNIISTINVCLIVSQAADFVRIFTESSNHVSVMVTDIILYISLLGAFFWLNSFGFYIWKTFKSRNVFLRVTDVRKYCYYSSVVWSSVALIAGMAICAHFLLDTGTNPYRKMIKQFSSSILVDDVEQETIGWLGIAIFFTPVAFTIIFNLFFYITTLKVIKRINIYGRIHYKLKGCFDLFLDMFVIMTASWVILLLSWLNPDGLLYSHIVVNLLEAMFIFYTCVVRQSHVTFLLRKSCSYAQPVPTGEWGDEMTHMNGGNY